MGGTSSGQAKTGEDFKFGSGTVTINPGQVTVFVPVTIYGDTDKEDTEFFNFIVSNVSGANLASGGIIHIEKGWIIDDDTATAPPPPEPEPEPTGPVYLSIDTNDPSEFEGSDGSWVEFDFFVRRSGDLDQRTDYRITFQGYGGTPLTADDFYDGQFPEDHGSFVRERTESGSPYVYDRILFRRRTSTFARSSHRLNRTSSFPISMPTQLS